MSGRRRFGAVQHLARRRARRKALGQAVKARRRALGLTQAQLAVRLGGTDNMIRQVEHGLHAPQLVDLAEWAVALEVNRGWFLESAG